LFRPLGSHRTGHSWLTCTMKKVDQVTLK
jgi:hypothetical protein